MSTATLERPETLEVANEEHFDFVATPFQESAILPEIAQDTETLDQIVDRYYTNYRENAFFGGEKRQEYRLRAVSEMFAEIRRLSPDNQELIDDSWSKFDTRVETEMELLRKLVPATSAPRFGWMRKAIKHFRDRNAETRRAVRRWRPGVVSALAVGASISSFFYLNSAENENHTDLTSIESPSFTPITLLKTPTPSIEAVRTAVGESILSLSIPTETSLITSKIASQLTHSSLIAPFTDAIHDANAHIASQTDQHAVNATWLNAEFPYLSTQAIADILAAKQLNPTLTKQQAFELAAVFAWRASLAS